MLVDKKISSGHVPWPVATHLAHTISHTSPTSSHTRLILRNCIASARRQCPESSAIECCVVLCLTVEPVRIRPLVAFGQFLSHRIQHAIHQCGKGNEIHCRC